MKISSTRQKYKDFGFTDSPMHHANKYCPSGNLFVKLENETLLGSIKARFAFYMLSKMANKTGKYLNQRPNVVESSSGNLALAFHALSEHFNVNFLCLTDETIPLSKQEQLNNEGLNVKFVQKRKHPDFRTARIAEAQRLGKMNDWVWVNQYANPENVRAHFETTGPELWEQTKGKIRWVIASVGSAGTICGVGKFLKQVNPQVNVVGVEPAGSTLFGGEPFPYISAGSGMHGPPRLLIQYGNCIDYFAKVPDIAAALECKKIEDHEGLCVGLTTGHNLAVASSIAAKTTDIVVVVSADSGKHYQSEIEKLCKDNSAANEIPELKRYSRNEKSD